MLNPQRSKVLWMALWTQVGFIQREKKSSAHQPHGPIITQTAAAGAAAAEVSCFLRPNDSRTLGRKYEAVKLKGWQHFWFLVHNFVCPFRRLEKRVQEILKEIKHLLSDWGLICRPTQLALKGQYTPKIKILYSVFFLAEKQPHWEMLGYSVFFVFF